MGGGENIFQEEGVCVAGRRSLWYKVWGTLV